jgi:acetyltransferase EpsM
MKNLELWIFGGGGHAKIIAYTALSLNKYKKITLFDKNLSEDTKNILNECNFKTEQPTNKNYEDVDSFIGIGDGIIRKKIKDKFYRHNFCNLVSNNALVSKKSFIEKGVFIAPKAIININSYISEHVIVNTNAVVEHDCKIGAFSHIGPSSVLCGGVTLKENVFIGAHACINPGIQICSNVLIGSGCVVTNDIHEPGIYTGIPAKKKS